MLCPGVNTESGRYFGRALLGAFAVIKLAPEKAEKTPTEVKHRCRAPYKKQHNGCNVQRGEK